MWSPFLSPLPTGVGSSCQLRNVGPLPPDPVTNLQLLSARKQFTPDRRSVVVTVQFNWTAPEFTGEGIVGYQVWLDRMPAPDDVTRLVTHGAQARAAEIERIFDIEGADFPVILQVSLHTYAHGAAMQSISCYACHLQIRPLGANTIGNWSRRDNRILQVRGIIQFKVKFILIEA